MFFIICDGVLEIICKKTQIGWISPKIHPIFLLQIMKLQLNRNINISLRLLERWSDDPLFMELYALYCMIKISRRDSRIRFKNQKDLLHKLGIGYSKFKNMTGHPMFDELFRMTDSTFVARRYRVNGVQLTLGCGKVNIPKIGF